jgi:hypothetical protein
MKPLQEKEGQIIKIVEVANVSPLLIQITAPNEQTMKMHEEIENIRQVLCKITTEAQTISDQNKILREVNYVRQI